MEKGGRGWRERVERWQSRDVEQCCRGWGAVGRNRGAAGEKKKSDGRDCFFDSYKGRDRTHQDSIDIDNQG